MARHPRPIRPHTRPAVAVLSGYARWLSLAAWAGLVVSLPLWLGWAGLVASAPLLLPLWGLWRGRSYTYAWTSLLALVYLAMLLTEYMVNPQPVRVAPSLFSTAALFTGCLLFVRLRSRESAGGG